MSERDPDAEVTALRAALAAEREKGELFAGEVRRLVADVRAAAARLPDADLAPDPRAEVERIRAACDALQGLADRRVEAVDSARARPAGRDAAVDSARARPAGRDAADASPTPPGPAADRPLVLLVEDNAVNQRVARMMLERRGYRADVASDGREAIACTARTTYAAVLMDCHMPNLDGYEATREIRARDAGKPRVPIIAMTADSGDGARDRCLGAGMDDYLPKPMTAEALDGVLGRWVASPPVASAPPPPRRPSSPAIDLGMLRGLKSAARPGEPDVVADVIALFLGDAPARMSALREAVARGDLRAAAQAAHALKGSAGHLGAKTLVALCGRFEDKVRAGGAFNATFVVEAIEEELERVRRALRAEAEKLLGTSK